jgi:signal transduction histidine kinase/ligand-binding sensor domain-containing protein
MDGYLWLGTDNGLFRFDGKRFEHFRPTSGGDILPGIAERVLALADGGLLVGYPFSGASYIKDGHVSNYGPKQGLKGGETHAFAQDQEGIIWAATNRGLWRWENSSWTRVGAEWNFPAPMAINVFVDHRGTVWVCTIKELYFRPKSERRFRLAENTYQILDITEATNGAVWVSIAKASLVKQLTAPNGDLIQSGRSYRFKGGTEDLYSILFPRDGSLWVVGSAINEGLFRIPSPDSAPAGTTTEIRNVAQHFSQKGLTSENYSLMQDQEGSIWMYGVGGIDQFRPAAFTAMEAPADFNRTAILADGADSILVGSGGHTPLIRVTQREAKVVPNSLQGYITCLYRDRHRKIWVGTSDGLWAFAGGKFTRQTLPKDIDPSFHVVQSMTMDPSGALWVSILHSGVMRFSRGVWTHGENLTASAHDPAFLLFTDSSGRVWIGNGGNRIDLLDNGKVTHFGLEIGLNVGDVTAIYEHGGQMWIAGESGFGFFRDGKFWHMELVDDAVPKGVTGIVQTANGDLWLNQASGVIHIVASEVARAQSDKTNRASFSLYDYLDGINTPVHQTIPVPTAIQTDDGTLYFGMRSTVVWTDPDHLPTNAIRPSVCITSIIADGKENKSTSPVILPARTQNLEINFTGLSLLIPQRVQFRYLLEGIDRDWQDAGSRRQALYSRLPPGEYKFRVIASNNDGVWNSEGASFRFSVAPAFNQTTWFILLCGIVLLALVWAAFQLRLRQVEVRSRLQMEERISERTRIARELHDTLLQSFQGLILKFQRARNLLPAQPEQAMESLDTALDRAERAIIEGRDTIHDIRTFTPVDTDLVGEITALGEELAASDGRPNLPTLRVVVEGSAKAVHPVVRNEILQIVREALRNAYAHANATSIEAEIGYEEKMLRLRIRDDGIGITQEHMGATGRAGHYGLRGMRERAAQMGTQLDVWTEQGAGTEIELSIPDRVAYKAG